MLIRMRIGKAAAGIARLVALVNGSRIGASFLFDDLRRLLDWRAKDLVP
jgi:hypothetical protein